ncbi:glycosyltransferase domain-containing protein [Synechococcus sp. CC9616]|uniref:glycosyltransferase domain-containing protein n=1 Tax=Synechococcus sp. CC9616 TaxID=110663 RepID=UPI000565D93F|nr:glycosyltransferase domain-containing protein [Synechococcus sp. CC9616]
MKFRIVSAHFGSKKPWDITPQSKHNFSFKYYDDNNTHSREMAMHTRLKSKIPKMLEWRFHKADWYIWMDSSIRINPQSDLPEEVLKTSQGAPLCLFKHPSLHTIEEEAQVITRKTRPDLPYFYERFKGEPINQQINSYLADSNFNDNALFQMTFFAYHYSARYLMQEWFLQNCIFTIKDQLSFPYVLTKSKLKYSLFSGSVANNHMFKWDWKSREQLPRR